MRKELLYNNCTINRKPPLNSDAQGFNFPTIKLTASLPDSYLYIINNALIAPHGIVMHKRKIVPESVDYAWKGRASRKTFYKRLFLGHVQHVKNSTIVIHNSYYQNYYHWMLEALPRLFSIHKQLDDISLIIPDKLSSFHHETLAYFNLKEIIQYPKTKLIKAESLLLPDPACQDYGEHNPKLIKDMASWLKEKTSITKTSGNGSPKKIFITRDSDKVRKLTNQDEIISLLTKYDFTPVMLEKLTIAEQINLFRNATCVAGVQGAGLSNMIFMPQDSLIINLINKNHHDTCFFNLANALNHKIIMQQCETVGETDLHPQHYNLKADITELENYLNKYLTT